MGCNVRCGVMHNVADTVRFEIWYCEKQVCCERCWCGMKCVICQRSCLISVECNVKCGGIMCDEVRCVIHSASHHHSSTIFHTIPHQFHIFSSIPPDHTSHGVMWNSVVWNLV